MINIPNMAVSPLNKNSLDRLNKTKTEPFNKDTVRNLNSKKFANQNNDNHEKENYRNNLKTVNNYSQEDKDENYSCKQTQKQFKMKIPSMHNLLHKGQKITINFNGENLKKIKVCFGWNILDERCDIDASTFLLTDNGKVLGEEWFVFYGQINSPDNTVKFTECVSNSDREIINIDTGNINPKIKRIVFVLTINEAYKNSLNFSMIEDAYIRLFEEDTNIEIASYKLEEYYSNIISMIMGELYIYNGKWKFNPVGNGVNRDLAGLCEMYGVEISR